MKRITLVWTLILCNFITFIAYSSSDAGERSVSIIPAPPQMTVGEGTFTVHPLAWLHKSPTFSVYNFPFLIKCMPHCQNSKWTDNILKCLIGYLEKMANRKSHFVDFQQCNRPRHSHIRYSSHQGCRLKIIQSALSEI